MLWHFSVQPPLRHESMPCWKPNAYFPWTICCHCEVQVLSLFFSEFAKIEPITVWWLYYSLLVWFQIPQILFCNWLWKTNRLYNIFSSGAICSVHAQFMTQTTVFSIGWKIGLDNYEGKNMLHHFQLFLAILKSLIPFKKLKIRFFGRHCTVS